MGQTALLSDPHSPDLFPLARVLHELGWEMCALQETAHRLRVLEGVTVVDITSAYSTPLRYEKYEGLTWQVHARLDRDSQFESHQRPVNLPAIDLLYYNLDLSRGATEVDAAGVALILSAIRGGRLVLTDSSDIDRALPHLRNRIWGNPGTLREFAHTAAVRLMKATGELAQALRPESAELPR